MFEKELRELGKKGLLRTILHRSSSQGAVIKIRGRRYLNFSSNDYLGLANHPELISSAVKAAMSFGTGSGSSRLLAGGIELLERLERDVSCFKSAPASLIFSSGYAANTGIIPALSSPGDLILSDELNHASIIDGCRLSRAKTIIYKHRDMAHLEELLKKDKTKGRKIIVTDSVFSMDGDIAPLPDICEISRKNGAVLYLDEAHATGVIGGGRGGLAHFNIRPMSWIIRMGTFSKALGSFGAFATAETDVIEWLTNRARSFMYSTALPPSVVAASIAALRIVRRDPLLISKLWTNRERLAGGLNLLGFTTMASETPIIPVRVGGIKRTLDMASFLFENMVYAPAIRPPTVKEPRLRITVTAAHTEKQIDTLLNLMERFSMR